MFKLRAQFFIVMLIICSLLTTGLYLFIKLSFKQDFWRYVEKKETRFTQPLVADLVQNFHDKKDWQWINNWDEYILAHVEVETREHMHANNQSNRDPQHLQPNNNREHDQEERRPPPPQITDSPAKTSTNDRGFRDWRDFRRMAPMGAMRFIFLLDENHQLVAGNNERQKDSFLIELNDGDKTVGYLGVPFNPAIRDLQDANFAHLQETKLALFIAIAMLIAALAAFPLAHLLTKRINLVVTQVSLFSKGDYRQKMSVKGKDELSILAEHVNALGETLAQSQQTRRQWVADISHELRTPIAVLQAELEAMEDGVRPLDKESVSRLIKHSQRLKHLVNDLYELSLTDLGAMTYRKSTVDIALLLKEAVNAMSPQFNAQQIELILTGIALPITLLGDQNRLQQLFINLLKNSLQYTNTPGKTLVTLHASEDKALVTIEDSAPGVAEEHHGKLFDRLYRADSSRNRATGGAGLGLSICKNIVTAHDGNISIGNSTLGGLKVTISIPR